MAVSLKKGGNVSLTKEAPSMKTVLFGLGWDSRKTDGSAFDLDASAFIVGEDDKVLSDASFIFFNNKTSACGGVVHQGDNRTGEGAGDDEQLLIHLDKVDASAKKVVFAVTIYEAEDRKQHFGMVTNAFIRAVNNDDQTELARYDLSEDAATETAMIFGELYRHNGEWKFKAVGQGYEGGLSALAKGFGVNI